MISSKIEINPKYDSFSSFIRSIPGIFDNEGELLYDERNKVRRFQKGVMQLVVKRYKKPLPFQRIDYTFFRASKARRAYQYALHLEQLQINTPEAVAYIEIKENGLFSTGYFVSSNCSDQDTRVLRQDDFNKSLADALSGFLAFMHQKGFLHGDLNLSNILFHINEDGRYQFSVIDTNRSKFKNKPSQEECLDNLKRLSHQRELLTYLIKRYAEIRHWDSEYCVSFVLDRLHKFERKRKIIRLLKGKK